MIALVSAKGSPGVTTSALAFTLTWPGRCLLAECDPAGGDVLAGYLRGGLDGQRGLAQLAVAELRGRLADEFERQLVDLHPPHRHRLLLPGVRDPAQSATVAPVWGAIAEQLRQLEAPAGAPVEAPVEAPAEAPVEAPAVTVIADCGRLAGPQVGWPVLQAADRVLLVLRGSLPSVSHAVPAIQVLRRELAERADRLGLLVVEAGPYRAGEVAERLQVPLAASLPADWRTARALSFGGLVHRRRPLARAAAAAHLSLVWQPEVAGAV